MPMRVCRHANPHTHTYESTSLKGPIGLITCVQLLIRDEIQSGKTDKEIFKKLEDDFGETVLYAPKFDLQTAALWLSPLIVAGGAVGVWAFNKHRKQTNVHIMALNLVRGVSLTPKEKETMLDLLTPPPSEGTTRSWWRRWQGQ
ncbi:cytochrome c-type biogenesis CcmH-like mitochondrial protein isoform X2 [Quercus robur]|uniref:cytochrome c-type biogenesis CcmH-like mitochondrial protein isoform X2 n=1 Tax=Quercus robur TaxID=38942 RepID=UPI00216143A2|nr:cytochrome c-type biogenesis CcmH-like mitochondrial protein isoform X2 [Quercus robur]